MTSSATNDPPRRGSKMTAHDIFGMDKSLVGMIHLLPLPGSPMGCDSLQKVIDRASREAEMLRDAGFDALLIENTHDRPYLMRNVGPEAVAAMTAVARVIRTDHDAPLGIQML
ncbi:MAG: BtpA/SgcQ family protein, partial [Phycisphaerales bacterium]|nr:BtpA/SgcQ family protein [Phycisphaerales bacterium]